MKRRTLWFLIVIVGAGALLRFWSLAYGIPFTLGVDEPQIIDRAVAILKTGDFNPHFFDYPSLYIYLQALVAIPRFVWGAMQGEWTTLAGAPATAFYLWARVVTAALGTATVVLVYLCARRWNEPTALLGAALMAVMPLHVRESHFALTDVPATFFVALTWYLTMLAQERRGLRRFVIAGVAAGLAAATKYNAVFALIMPVLAALTTEHADAGPVKRAAVVLIAATVAFLVATPYAVLDLPAFLDGFARLIAAYHGVAPQPPAVTYAKHLRIALGWAGTVAVVVGLAVAFIRAVKGPDRVQWLLPVIVPTLYFYFISRQQLVFARYLLPVVPFVAVLGAIAVVEFYRVLLSRVPVRTVVAAGAAGAIAGLVIWPGANTAVQFDRGISQTWTSELAYRWIQRTIPQGTRIVIESRALVLPNGYQATNVPQLRMKPLEKYRAEGVTYLVASSQCYGPYLASPANEPAGYADYQRLFQGTEELARFSPSDRHPGAELRILRIRQ